MYSDTRTSLKNRFRGLVKTGCAAGMHWSSLDRFVGSRLGLKNAPLVVGYHRVVQDFGQSDALSISPMLISARTFAQHLDWIGQHYEFVSLDELALIVEETRNGEKKTGKPVAAITFDDGYRDVYLNALPILKRRGIPSAIFVVTDLIGTSQLLPHDELHLLLSGMLAEGNVAREHYWQEVIASLGIPAARLKRLYRHINGASDPFLATRIVLETLRQSDINTLVGILRKRIFIHEDKRREFQLLDWDMLQEMVRQGVTVGSHTRSHALLANEPSEVVRDEIAGSRRELEQRLGIPIKHFAYPDGRFDKDAIRAVAAAGYHTAYTICGHRDRDDPRLTVSRKMLWENACMDSFGRFSPAILSCQANGIFDPADRCRLQHWS